MFVSAKYVLQENIKNIYRTFSISLPHPTTSAAFPYTQNPPQRIESGRLLYALIYAIMEVDKVTK